MRAGTDGKKVNSLNVFETQFIMLCLRSVHGTSILLQFGLLVIESLREFHLSHAWLAKDC